MEDPEAVKARIRVVFAQTPYPGDDNLRCSNQGDEPYLVERDFKGKRDWTALDPDFIDQSPERQSSALCFFTDEAFRFYIPAYMIADLDERLKYTDPVFFLTYHLDDSARYQPHSQDKTGEKTLFDEGSERFHTFTREEAISVVDYLIYKKETAFLDQEREEIEQALANYWRRRAE